MVAGTRLHRRSLITGLVSLLAAPAIVRAGSLMPVKSMVRPIRVTIQGFDQFGNQFSENLLFSLSEWGLNERGSYSWREVDSVIVG